MCVLLIKSPFSKLSYQALKQDYDCGSEMTSLQVYFIVLHLQWHLLSQLHGQFKPQVVNSLHNSYVEASYLAHNAVVCGVWASTSIWTFEPSFSGQFSHVTLQTFGKIVNKPSFVMILWAKLKRRMNQLTCHQWQLQNIPDHKMPYFLKWPIP